MILKVLEDTLNTKDITDLLPNGKVYHLHITDKPLKPYLEYEVVSDEGISYAENKELYRQYLVQIDLFSDKKNYYDIANIVKSKMLEAGFTLDKNNPELYEDTTKLYHKVLRFNICLPS